MRSLPALLMVFLAPCAAAAQAQDRVTGQVSYLDRMALPDDAVLLVEALAPDGQVLSELRLPAEGAQVPLQFALDLPALDQANIRAGIILGAELVWLGAPVPVTQTPLDLVLQRYQPIGFNATFRCGDAVVQTGFADDALVLDTGAQRLVLQPVATASGARYDAVDDPGTYVWNRGDAAEIVVNDTALPPCLISLPPVTAAYVARGNEPFWTARFAKGALVVDRLGMDAVSLPVTDSGLQTDGAIFVTAGPDAGMLREDRVCADTMAGMPYPETVTLTLGAEVLTGCGGDSRDLLTGRTWRVTAVGDEPLPDDSRPTLVFDSTGRVNGTGSCNNWFANYQLTGEALTFAAAGATMMACDADLMQQDRVLLDALAQVTGFGIAPDGGLVLRGGDAPLMRAVAAD